jgi:HSP20 family protein
MPIRDLIPWKRQDPARQESEEKGVIPTEQHPHLTFQQEMDRLFDRFFGRSGLEPFGVFREAWDTFNPRLDAVETDQEVKVSVELPGLDEKDIDVSLTRDLLTISGVKRQEHEKESRNYFRSERSYGSFKRSIPLPCEVESGTVEAVFRNGVLTVTLPKADDTQTRRKVAIRGK